MRGWLTIGLGVVLLGLALFFGLRALIVRDTANPAAPTQGTLTSQLDSKTEAPKEPEAVQTPDPVAQSDGDAKNEDESSPAPTLTSAADENVKLLPIIRRKKDETKMVAITVDDCFSADVMKSLLKFADKNEVKLTFFPKGNTIRKNAAIWRKVFASGHEIGNHTFTHTDVSRLKGDDLPKNIKQASDALNEVLGVNYHMRVFRCPTGDGEKLPRLHQVLRDMGYEAVASWGLSGTRKASETIRLTQGGQILLFHANKKQDLDRLKKVIPGLLKRGFKLVTINELYGKEPNLVTELETAE